MYKLIILIESTSLPGIHNFWPRFLHAAENIPGLRREATSRINQVLYGNVHYALVHELFFDTSADLQAGLSSQYGKEAGRILQDMTGGNVKLLIADHSEDELENIRKYRALDQDAKSKAGHA